MFIPRQIILLPQKCTGTNVVNRINHAKNDKYLVFVRKTRELFRFNYRTLNYGKNFTSEKYDKFEKEPEFFTKESGEKKPSIRDR